MILLRSVLTNKLSYGKAHRQKGHMNMPQSTMLCCARLYVLCCSDNADLEAVLKETERQRREFAARYAFMTLDTDGDGYVSVEQVSPAQLTCRHQRTVNLLLKCNRCNICSCHNKQQNRVQCAD